MITCSCLFTSKYIFYYQRCLSGKFDILCRESLTFLARKKESISGWFRQIRAYWSCAMPVPQIFPVTQGKIRYPAE
jgi:hypothetical protein